MTSRPFDIDPAIERAHTLPGRIYSDPEAWAVQRDRVFARAWHFIGETERVKAPGHVLPFTLLEGCLDEPLVLARADDGELHCYSNACTHRGALVVEGEGHLKSLRCRYHGRKFGLDGRFQSMPEFGGVAGFPSSADDLPRVQLRSWGPLLFASIDPLVDFDEWIAPVRARCDFMPLDGARFDAASSRDYDIDANWALYCDNYLEEFHIPYVHRESLAGIDYEAYRTELFSWSNLQYGYAKDGRDAFALPAGHPDAGESLAAFYFWLFPNLMLNFYPWGLSLNLVRPMDVGRTIVSFKQWVWDPSKRDRGLGSDLHRVEMEDEEVVESVQRGVSSRLYDRGRYSPRREVGTHHFHTLLARAMAG